MRATLHDAALESYAGRFVRLELDFDKPQNEPFLSAHEASGYPMLYVIDPDGTVLRTWSGGASVHEVAAFLDSALAPPKKGKADQALARGEKLLGAGDAAGAVVAYRDALQQFGGKTFAARGRTLEQLFLALQMVGDNPACVKAALELVPGLPRAHTFVATALVATLCATGLPPDDKTRRVETLGLEALAQPSASQDDTYMLYEALYALRKRAGDAPGAKALAQRYFDFVEKLPAPRGDDERMARELARVRAAVKLGVVDRILPGLEQTEKDLPDDVDASSRLATAYLAVGRWDDAIAAAIRGLGRKPGPEGALRLLVLRGSAEAKKGDVAAARQSYEAALESGSHIATRSSREGMLARVKKERDALPAPP